MTRTYQQQLDHLNTMVGKMHNHKNKALNRKKVPVAFDEWLEETQDLLAEADDEEVYTIQIEEEGVLPNNSTEDELFECYINVLKRSADLLATKKQVLRVKEFEASSEYYTCAGDKEYEMMANEFRVRGEVIRLEPQEMVVMRMILSSGGRIIKSTDIGREIYNDREYVIEAPHIISDINSKIKKDKDSPNPIARIAGERLSDGRRASVWHLYLDDEPRPLKR